LYVRASDGSGADQLLLTTDAPKTASSWSRDGRFVLFTATSPTTGDDIWLLPLFGDRTPVPLVQSSFAESAARWSPDMRWISYTSNASGRFEIYVRPCNPVSPGAVFGAVTQVSQNGGVAPRWRRDGKELYYVTPAGAVTAVEISGSTLTLGAPKTLFTLPAGAPWDVAPDGQRFLVGMPPAAAALTPITVVLNWTSVLR
jgi:Tol biopolymer transport system component